MEEVNVVEETEMKTEVKKEPVGREDISCHRSEENGPSPGQLSAKIENDADDECPSDPVPCLSQAGAVVESLERSVGVDTVVKTPNRIKPEKRKQVGFDDRLLDMAEEEHAKKMAIVEREEETAKRKEETARRKEETARRKEETARRKEETARRKEETAKLKQERVRVKLLIAKAKLANAGIKLD